MESDWFLELSAIFLLILANGFFALSEFSIIASRKSKLKQLIKEGKRGAAIAEKLHRNPDKFLATVQVGITLISTLAGVFGGATIVAHIEKLVVKIPFTFIHNSSKSVSVILVAIGITFFSALLGELVPKYLALTNPEYYGRHVAYPINIFIKLSSFFSTILSSTANFLISLFTGKKKTNRFPITEEEINLMIYEGKEKGVFDEIEEKLIKAAFDFSDSTIRRAITPRTDVVGLEINTPPKEIIQIIIENGYSRYPIFEKDIDHIVGILYTKDIIIHKLDPQLIILKDLLRKPLFVPDSMSLSKLLNIFQKQKKHIAIVLDEFGGTAGIITLEDVLEELVGEIQDEYDMEPEPLVKHSDTVAYAEGSVWPGSINELMNSKLPEDKADTLAGLFIDYLGRLPEKNESIVIADMKLTVLEQEDNRLVRLKLEKVKPHNQ